MIALEDEFVLHDLRMIDDLGKRQNRRAGYLFRIESLEPILGRACLEDRGRLVESFLGIGYAAASGPETLVIEPLRMLERTCESMPFGIGNGARRHPAIGCFIDEVLCECIAWHVGFLADERMPREAFRPGERDHRVDHR